MPSGAPRHFKSSHDEHVTNGTEQAQDRVELAIKVEGPHVALDQRELREERSVLA